MKIQSAVLKSAILAAAVLFAIIGVRAFANLQARHTYMEKVAFDVGQATRIVESSLNRNFHALRDIEVILSSADTTGASFTTTFQRYIDGTQMFAELPALRGMAVFEYVTTEQLPNLVTMRNSEQDRKDRGYPPLVLGPLSDGPQHAIITMIAPLERGVNELGADIMARDRAAILLKAAERRQLTLSSPFTLFTGETAVSLFQPFYRDDNPQTPAGFVASALSTETFLNGLKSQLATYELELSVADAGLIDSAANPAQDPIQISSNLSASDGVVRREIEVGGRIWQLELRPTRGLPKLIPVDFLSLLAAVVAALSGFTLYRTLRSAQVLSLQVAKRTFELDQERQEALMNAQIDDLTGLLNRRGLEAAFAKRVAQPQTDAPALISFDLDNFKQINDTLGHASGDDLLREFAKKLREISDEDAILVRFGGDEFGVLLFAPRDVVAQTADAILDWARTAHVIGGHLMRFGTSAGIAIGTSDDCDLATVVVNADIALYAAKDDGRDQVRFFDDEMREGVIRSKSLADDIWRGLENDEFVPFFQSQHDATTHCLTGVEVLVRWHHPTRGILPPGAFLDIADKIGATKTIDRRVLELAGYAIHRLEGMGQSIPAYSVNVSLNRMLEPDILTSIQALPATNARLAFEILESDFLDNPSEALLWRLDELRDAGVCLEVDDFGSGRASIIALKRLSPDRLKIDKGLILPLTQDPAMKILVASIAEMGRALGIMMTAEGVETLEHAEIVTSLGIDTLQGFYFSKPVSEQDLARLALAA